MGKPVTWLAARVEALSEHISNENDGYFGGSAPEDHLGNIESYVERLESRNFEPRWIPVEERLPDDDITVMIAMKDGDEPVWLGYYDGDCWYSIDATPIRTRVTHWRPMPEGPTKEEREDADVGNFAMMIADNMASLPALPAKPLHQYVKGEGK